MERYFGSKGNVLILVYIVRESGRAKLPTSRNLISRWSVSTASCRRWRPQEVSGGDLGLGAAIGIMDRYVDGLGGERASWMM